MSEEDTATSIVFISTKYFKLPAKQSERMRISFVCFPKTRRILATFSMIMGSDMTKEEFRQLCKTAWEKQYRFVIIDLSSKKYDGEYRSGLDEFYIPN